MDILIDKDFNIVYNKDLRLVDNVDEEKQRLYIYLKSYKGCLYHKPHWGFDNRQFLQIARVKNIYNIKSYLLFIIQQLNINIASIEITFIQRKLIVEFNFVGDSIPLQWQVST